jgi:diguanylate cyclase (GGDEF)-like protein
VLAESLRKPDDAFRIGGDEFAVLLAGADAEGARRLGARLARRLARRGPAEGLGLSYGVAMPAKGGEPLDDVMRRADQALYESKKRSAEATRGEQPATPAPQPGAVRLGRAMLAAERSPDRD